MIQDRISVIIPAYNAEMTICRAIDSVLQQRGVYTEIIVIDDGSQDSTSSKIRYRYAHLPQVKILQSESNKGPAQARNMGIEHATRDWIAFLDADDWFAPERLSTLLSTALQYKLDIIADSYYLTRDLETIPHSVRFAGISRPSSLSCLPPETFIRLGLGSVKPLFRKSLLDNTGIRFDPSTHQGEDTLFICTLLLHKSRFGLLNKPMYFRSESPVSLSKSDKIKLLLTMHDIFEQLLRLTTDINRCNFKVINALKYRARVVSDALAAEQWNRWVNGKHFRTPPKLTSLFQAARHLILKNQRYHTKKLSH